MPVFLFRTAPLEDRERMGANLTFYPRFLFDHLDVGLLPRQDSQMEEKSMVSRPVRLTSAFGGIAVV